MIYSLLQLARIDEFILNSTASSSYISDTSEMQTEWPEPFLEEREKTGQPMCEGDNCCSNSRQVWPKGGHGCSRTYEDISTVPLKSSNSLSKILGFSIKRH
jgi:hypothetical protein